MMTIICYNIVSGIKQCMQPVYLNNQHQWLRNNWEWYTMTNKNNKANSDKIFEITWHFRVHMLLPHGASFHILYTSFWLICLADHVYQPVSCWYCKIILCWHHFRNFRQRFWSFSQTKKVLTNNIWGAQKMQRLCAKTVVPSTSSRNYLGTICRAVPKHRSCYFCSGDPSQF